MTDGRQKPARRLARHVSSLWPPPKRAKNKSWAHIFGGCLRRPSPSCHSMSLGLVNTAPNCRLNFSPMSTPGAKAALKHYYDCDAPFSPPVRPAPRSRDPEFHASGAPNPPQLYIWSCGCRQKTDKDPGEPLRQALNATYASHRTRGSWASDPCQGSGSGSARGYSANLWPCLLQPLFFV